MADKKKPVLQETVEHIESILSTSHKCEPKSSWDCVLLSRQSGRPGAKAFISMICDQFMELHGDRTYGDDPAMIGGIGW